jgi:F-type H+-transporting ATPase subunit delta
VLAEAKRLVLLENIAEIFLEFRHRDQAILAIHVTAAQPLSATMKQSMKDALEQRFKKTVELHCATDPTLLGGAIIRADDEDFVIDGSVRGKLQRLERILIG